LGGGWGRDIWILKAKKKKKKKQRGRRGRLNPQRDKGDTRGGKTHPHPNYKKKK